MFRVVDSQLREYAKRAETKYNNVSQQDCFHSTCILCVFLTMVTPVLLCGITHTHTHLFLLSLTRHTMASPTHLLFVAAPFTLSSAAVLGSNMLFLRKRKSSNTNKRPSCCAEHQLWTSERRQVFVFSSAAASRFPSVTYQNYTS